MMVLVPMTTRVGVVDGEDRDDDVVDGHARAGCDGNATHNDDGADAVAKIFFIKEVAAIMMRMMTILITTMGDLCRW